MNIDIVTITPEMAQTMLTGNTNNRSVKRVHVNNIARDMAAGRWQANGDAIRFNGDGTLLDGQHRLMACVQSGVAFRTVVISGLASETRDTIDVGSKRSAGDRLQLKGVKNANKIAAALRFIAGIATGQFRNVVLTETEKTELFSSHPGIADSVLSADKGMGLPLSHIAGLHYIGTFTGHAGRADAMVKVTQTGIPDYDGDPIHLLRDRALRYRGTSNAFNPLSMAKLATYAWVKFRDRQPVRLLKMPDAPTIDGWGPEQVGR